MQIKNKGIVGVAFGLAVGLAIGVVVSLQAGPLTPPPTAVSGGVPVSTMKTLDQIPPTWDRILPANNSGDPCDSSRFTCVMGGVAVRDNETGLVWERSPDSTETDWNNAVSSCSSKILGNRQGWRLPTLQELDSLIDGSQTSPNGSIPALAPGHPFPNLLGNLNYWVATTQKENAANAFIVNLNNAHLIAAKSSFTGRHWCVRGGSGLDAQ
jgi:hypothetical protein